VDGNKRTAVRATEMFLVANGIQATWEHDEIAPFVLKIATGDIEIEAIAAWLHEQTEVIPDDD